MLLLDFELRDHDGKSPRDALLLSIATISICNADLSYAQTVSGRGRSCPERKWKLEDLVICNCKATLLRNINIPQWL